MKDDIIKSCLRCATHYISTGYGGDNLNAVLAYTMSDKRYPVDVQVSFSFLLDTSDTNSTTLGGWKAWMARAEPMPRTPDLRCKGQLALRPTALVRAYRY